MSLEEDINKIEKKTEKMSVAMEMLTFAKEQNGLVVLLCVSIGYTIYILNDTTVVDLDDDTIEIQEIEQIDGSTIKIGDDIWEKSQLEEEN